MALLFPDPAASLPGESELLTHVADDLTDETRKLVYADWLDDHDDPRGKFLRDFVEARQAGRPLIQDESLAPSWRHVTGLELERSLVEYDLVEYRRAILTLARPAIELDYEIAEEESELGTSRIGGRPDVPADFQWPYPDESMGAEHRNVPYSFIAQFRLEDLRNTVVADLLPKKGLLALFNFQGFFAYAMLARVIETGLMERRELPLFDASITGYDPEITVSIASCNMIARETLNIADSLRYPQLARFRPDLLTPEQAKNLNYNDYGEVFARDDSLMAGNFGILFGRQPRYGDGENVDKYFWPEWLHFITIQSNEEIGVRPGDSNNCMTWIRQDDLRNKNFANLDSSYA